MGVDQYNFRPGFDHTLWVFNVKVRVLEPGNVYAPILTEVYITL
jgi:hypothetical protein